MDNIFKPTKKNETNNSEGVYEGALTITAWLNDEKQNSIITDCHGNDIIVVPVSFLNDDKGEWKKSDRLLKSFIGKLKNPVMIIKEYENSFIKAVTPNKVMKFSVFFKKKPALRLGAAMDGSKVLKGISDDYYFYNSDTIRFIIFDDSVENEKKMREIL